MRADENTPAALFLKGAGGILSRAEAFSDNIDRIRGTAQNPLDLVIDEPLSSVEAVIHGRTTVMFGTNSYLGLNFHPNCIRAANEACSKFGTGSTASRAAAGNHRAHVELEAEVARFFGRRHAILFSTGFMANLGVIASLARQGDAVVLDSHCHASIFDAARLSGAETKTFRHNDSADLDRVLGASSIRGNQTVLVVEGLYSVWGDVGELEGIVQVGKRHGAFVIVDEAHSLGAYGKNGRGVVELLGLEDSVDVVVGTFSKSIGVIGGFSVTDHDALRSLRFMARPYLYTASLPPSITAAAREALSLLGSEPELRSRLWHNARAFHAGLNALGYQLSAEPGPVGSVRMQGSRRAYSIWAGLLERGIYVNLLIPPATPSGEFVLRYSVSSAHTQEHIDRAMEAFRALAV